MTFRSFYSLPNSTTSPPLPCVLSSLLGTDIVIEGSRVERIGGQCLQILLAATSTWNTDGAVLEFVNPSLEFIAGLELVGICPATFLNRERS